ncbi:MULTISPECIES: Sec-independent protein translocase protein TatB [unclassified Lysobacter]|uniref:Sec-independent protein translocase protein TatB n=1 Tax=unclassified Lysobacter TaxID=2635362 RepID=UPI001C21B2F0|nr:Sec-independent protein translocase protein TatB [Lysobacter sp. MMG2]MBU8977284.1 Sec-independent protein translocase protein TatB [Lysobacter sp. MMG2]
MFDIGFSEIFVIAIVALLVLGPERLPKAARFAGLWVRRARAQWYSVKSELENELAAEELKRSLRETQDSLREAQQELNAGIDEARNRIKREQEDLQRELDALDRDVRDTAPAEPVEIEERPLASATDPALQPPEPAPVDTALHEIRPLPVETDSEPVPVRPAPSAADDGAQRR